MEPYAGNNQVLVGNGDTLPISSIGHLSFLTHTKPLFLRNILVDPKLTKNLLSVAKFFKDNSCSIEFNPLAML